MLKKWGREGLESLVEFVIEGSLEILFTLLDALF